MNGWTPGQFQTPPPPQNFSVGLDSTGTNIILNWQTGGGPVDHYEIDEGDDSDPVELGTVTNDVFTYTDDSSFDLLEPQARRVVAVFANGDQSPTAWKLPALDRSAVVFRGTGGQFYLALPNVPQNLAGINFISSLSPIVIEYVDATNMVNGILQIPQDLQSEAARESGVGFVQLVDTSGNSGDYLSLTFPLDPEHGDDYWNAPTNFANASSQMKANLGFLLRAAGVLWPFGYSSGLYYNVDGMTQHAPTASDAATPETCLARGTASTNYEYYGYHTFSPSLNYSFIDELRPVEENFLWRNFVFNPNDFTNSDGVLSYCNATGAYGAGTSWGAGLDNLGLNLDVLWPTAFYAKYQYTGTGTENPLPIAFDSSDSSWIFIPGYSYFDYIGADQGVSTNDILETGIANIYGLGLNSAYVDTNFVEVGSALPTGDLTFENYTAANLQIVDYYFNSQTPFFNFVDTNAYGDPYSFTGSPPVLPGSPAFSPTNTSPLLITGVGQPMTVSGWAKMQIANGNTNKFGYLEQYFDFGQAYTVDTNGLLTTNSAGRLSPYGDFFPTVPGPAALVTMPDVDSGQRGTSVVSVIKLQLDVNHDGTMDLSFGGPDNTSQAHPFEFWINNDRDYSSTPVYNNSLPASFDYGQDTTPVNGGDSSSLWISSMRDLEDYARMWICGVPALPTGQGYSATLSWNAINGNPSIKIFNATDPNGGTSYLTDTNAALLQINMNDGSPSGVGGAAFSVGTISTSSSYRFTTQNFFDGTQKHLLFDAVGAGNGELVFTIYQGMQHHRSDRAMARPARCEGLL